MNGWGDKQSRFISSSGVALMPELDYKPVNRYLPPRPRRTGGDDAGDAPASNDTGNLASRWLNRILKR